MKKINKIIVLCLLTAVFLAGCGTKQAPVIGEVTMSIRCDTAIEKGVAEEEKWKDILPSDGCILPVTEMELREGDTVFDLLMEARDQYDVQVEYSGGKKSRYIEGIGNLYERDGGRWSGWMYSVNGEYPGTGCSEYELQDGDEIVWAYTCDLGADLGNEMEGAQEWMETHE